MSLRSLRRQLEGGSTGISNYLRFGRNNRFSKLSVAKRRDRCRRDMLIISIIVVITITIISIELVMWGGRQTHTEQIFDNTSGTSAGPTPQEEEPPLVTKPDLDIRSFNVVSGRVFVGERLTITTSVKNKGDYNTTNVTVALFLGDTPVATKTVSIAADETMDLTFEWTPTEDQVGQHALRLVIDPDNMIDERNEENNREGEEIEVRRQLVEDVSKDFKLQSTYHFNTHWYSNKFVVPPQGGETYTYFQLTREDTSLYYLDIVVPGFRATNNNNIFDIQIPDTSESGWNGGKCIKKSMGLDACIWTGPQIRISLEINGNRLVATDQNGREDKTTTSDDDIDDIRLAGMQTARWPGKLKTWRVYNSPELDSFIPTEFYEIVGDDIFIHPMRWNPKTLDAEVALWFRFEIETD